MRDLFNSQIKTLNSLQEQVQQINLLETKMENMSNAEMRESIQKLIKQYRQTSDTTPILIESFALTREMSKRTLGLRHFDSQLLGGLILNEGKIAEMKTGEGKTLAATLPLVFNALSLKGAHLVTVNDYLAKRDQQWMGKIYNGLGLSVGLIQEGMESPERQKNYAANITYVTNSELAFDYLRDNRVTTLEELTQRDFNYCIVDEVDSILIDEARTPLIISQPLDVPIEKYVLADEVTRYLQNKQDYLVNEKEKNIVLTSQGLQQVEKILNISNLYDKNDPWIPYVINALKAQSLFVKDTNYIVKNKEILIIDEFTGRIMPDRRWSEGLHQAIEAKENIPIKQGSEVLSSITYQNFFRLYPKLSGMTGTGKTAEDEFQKFYNLSVVELPTTNPVKRNDLGDLVCNDEYTKWKKITNECVQRHKKGQPILIGTVSIEKSEILSQLLTEQNIAHNLLNAKPENIQKESAIIAQAGKMGAVTVATNMAGRGTDILLGGNPDFQTKQILIELQNLNLSVLNTMLNKGLKQSKSRQDLEQSLYLIQNLSEKQLTELIDLFTRTNQPLKNANLKKLQSLYNDILNINIQECKTEKRKIEKLGGLCVIGTERHESKRIDNQLRGRSGRQGDPGISMFYLSLEDDLCRIFGGETLQKLMSAFDLTEESLNDKTLTKSLDDAQKRIENYFYESRKQLFNYDEILNIQRLSLLSERKEILKTRNLKTKILNYGATLIKAFLNNYEATTADPKTKFLIKKEISYLLGSRVFTSNGFSNSFENKEEIYKKLKNQLWFTYDLKEAEFETYLPGILRLLEKELVLNEINEEWKNHLQKMELLKDSIRWRGYGQFDPLTEYKREGYNLFVETIQNIKYNSVYNILKSKVMN